MSFGFVRIVDFGLFQIRLYASPGSELSMEKSIYSREYSLFLGLLRNARETAGLTQAEIAEDLGQTQSFVSKVERGERRIDVVELRAFCTALNISFTDFSKTLDAMLADEL